MIPLHRSNATPPDVISSDWANQILAQIFFKPDPATGIDMSVRAYIRAASYGVADLDAVVLPMQTVALDLGGFPQTKALEEQLGPQLRSQGFDRAAWVMNNSGILGDSGFPFWLALDTIEPGSPSVLGVWTSELIRSFSLSVDLKVPFTPFLPFEGMACECGTHPTAYTKSRLGWLSTPAITQHVGRSVVDYTLHSIGLIQPPPSGRSAAVRIGTQPPYLMVEARQRVDRFDSGIPSEGVIVYRVRTEASTSATLDLLTTTALAQGQAFTSDTGVTVSVTGALPGGFAISILDVANTEAIVPDVVLKTANKAASLIEAAGLAPVFQTQQGNQWVFSQSPKAGSIVAAGSKVTMVLHSGPLP